ncbi:hypothetical protein H6F89_17660 [Cyanobacteria bacterium FACHB-63]|nr:hypothetical protein [Cyanobacteria bacterium FACHB-63]
MASSSYKTGAIVRTERGLTIAGTRITLYDVMDYVTAQYPPKFIQGLIARIAAQPPKPGREAIRAKIQAAKAKFKSQS